ncbi:MAG TPA: hypothetical protein VGK59_02375 [Ohtaekwangia sp.]
MKINVLLFCCLVGLSATAQESDGFELVKKDGTTSVFERWITYPNSNPPFKAREVKGEFYYNNSIYAGLHLVQNEEKISKWQSHVSKFEVYLQADSTEWHEYSYHDIPWPVSDQDHYLVYTLSVISPTKLFVTFKSAVDATRAPVEDGVSRMELSGSWTWEEIAPNRTKATYIILSKPNGLPKWLTDPIIRGNIMTTIREYIEVLEGKR